MNYPFSFFKLSYRILILNICLDSVHQQSAVTSPVVPVVVHPNILSLSGAHSSLQSVSYATTTTGMILPVHQHCISSQTNFISPQPMTSQYIHSPESVTTPVLQGPHAPLAAPSYNPQLTSPVLTPVNVNVIIGAAANGPSSLEKLFPSTSYPDPFKDPEQANREEIFKIPTVPIPISQTVASSDSSSQTLVSITPPASPGIPRTHHRRNVSDTSAFNKYD